MVEYIVRNRETGDVLAKGDSVCCAEVVGCEYSYIRTLAKLEHKLNSKYSMFEVERIGDGKGERGGAHKRDVICCDCGLLMKNTSVSRRRCPECARKHSNASKAQRMREIRGTANSPSPIRNPNIKGCEGCIYLRGEYDINKCCNYIFIKGERRPCPPGEGCTVKIDRGKQRAKEE